MTALALSMPTLGATQHTRRQLVSAPDVAATDADIIASSLRKPQLFAPIFERHFTHIYRYLCQRTEPSAAEDLASEVFTIALNKRNKFVAQHDSALPWLYGIASRLLADQSRKRARQANAYYKASAQEIDHSSPMTGAQQRIDAHNAAQKLQPAIDALSDRDKDILHLYAHADLSYTDIAEALKMPVGTVRSRLHRIRKSLRNAVPTVKEA